MRRNKKGNLVMDSLPGIIIAVLCLLILGGTAYLVWKALTNDEYSRAQTAINFIENKMNALKDGQSTSFSIQSPCKEAGKCEWFIYGWGKGNTKTDERPDRCYFNSCVCICQGDVRGKINDIRDACQNVKTGICRIAKQNNVNVSRYDLVRIFEPQEVQRPGASIKYYDEKQWKSGIMLTKPLLEIRIDMGKEEINISSTEGD